MYYGYSPEQEQFREVLARFLTERAPISAVRAQMASDRGHDPALWRALAEDLGLTGVHLPERCGGQGFGFEELCIAQEELGRALTCAPFFATSVLASGALMELASEAEQDALLPALIAGERLAALAWMEEDGQVAADATTLGATRSGEAATLSGHKHYVIDGLAADLLLVVARDSADGALGLYAVNADSPGLTRRALATIDTTRRLAALEFDGCVARPLGAGRDFAAGFARLMDRATIALAAEMMGGARALLDQAVDYARLRMQFGRPIGAFQAIKHKLADLLLEVEVATAAVRYAAAAVDADDPEVPALASQAKAMAAEAYLKSAIDSIQIHGGIGFTWDHDSHLWFKRAKSSEVLLGDAAWHRERFLALTEAAA
ncbi:MAG: acyl-CoA/acyl-ACP dehydrogenase [Gammaproteobacteria bacterium]|nr:acyl-CoA/acyl-ACP dehydrogenase [Gammaproteobacteria bacterium]